MSDMNEWLKERRRINEMKPSGPGCWADSYNTLPTLLTAVEKVLEVHQPVDPGVGDEYWKEPDYCPTCAEYYPCLTVRAIEGAINE